MGNNLKRRREDEGSVLFKECVRMGNATDVITCPCDWVCRGASCINTVGKVITFVPSFDVVDFDDSLAHREF